MLRNHRRYILSVLSQLCCVLFTFMFANSYMVVGFPSHSVKGQSIPGQIWARNCNSVVMVRIYTKSTSLLHATITR